MSRVRTLLRRTGSLPAGLLAVALLLAGCGDDGAKNGGPTSTPPTPSGSSTGTTTTPAVPDPSPDRSTSTAPPSATRTPEPEPRRGIDASHHQGPIDWRQVADAGITFAYLKASEGTGFTDPRFAENRRAATRAGIDVAGYHYFQLCSDGGAQAQHFLDVVGDEPAAIPHALDLELAGSCTTPPPAETLLAEVREFLDVVDRRTGRRTLVYLYPDFEERFGFADDLADHPQWVRRLGDRPPRRDWTVWQHDDAGSVPGISGGVDLNLARESLTDPGR